jgi:hypothetical protein
MGLRPTQAFGPETTFHRTIALSLSSRAKPRDLQFCGPLLETRNPVPPQNCHLACPGVPWNRSEAQWRDLRFPPNPTPKPEVIMNP